LPFSDETANEWRNIKDMDLKGLGDYGEKGEVSHFWEAYLKRVQG
jgi:hypothetical protein